MAYGLAEGLRKTKVKLGGKGKTESIVATFGNHFIMNEALGEFQRLGLKCEVAKDHVVTVHLEKTTKDVAQKVRKIIQDHYGYVEPP